MPSVDRGESGACSSCAVRSERGRTFVPGWVVSLQPPRPLATTYLTRRLRLSPDTHSEARCSCSRYAGDRQNLGPLGSGGGTADPQPWGMSPSCAIIPAASGRAENSTTLPSLTLTK